ncbi:hypothetical protein ABTQ33_09005 [Paucilactobacillus suebicus]|nr:hypothetical protein [Paucilactobacillus suebicus]
MHSKSNKLAFYNFKSSLMHLGLTYVWFIGIVYLLPSIFSLLFSGSLSFNFLGWDWMSFIGTCSSVGVFYLMADGLIFNYDNFKLAIQNGISRRTSWIARIKNTVMLSLVVLVLDLLSGIFDSRAHLICGTLYVGLFNRNSGLDYVVAPVFDLIALFSLAVTFLAIGNGLALLSKRGKLAVVIGVPIVFFFLLVQIVRVIVHFQSNVTPFIKLMIGYSDSIGINPVNITIFILIWGALMTLLSYVFSSKMKLRRD